MDGCILKSAVYGFAVGDAIGVPVEFYEISDLTHRTIECEIACHIYVEYAIRLIKGKNKEKAWEHTVSKLKVYYKENVPNDVFKEFQRIFDESLPSLPSDEICSDGYVINTLEAVLWCLITSDSFKETALKAVNLGGDTDTIAAVACGLAGIIYGYDDIPGEWLKSLRGKKIINKVLHNCEKEGL